MVIIAAEALDWGKLVVDFFVALLAFFACTGFWELRKTKFLAKREDKKEEKDYDSKLEHMSEQMTGISDQVTSLSDKFDFMAEDMQELKKDIILLQQANEETVKYRELRDAQDRKSLKAQEAVIESLKGLLRDRLLEVYKQCIAKGYYTKEERETYGELFTCYESEPFDGNGVMHQLRPIVQALPWTAEDAGKLNDTDSDD